MLSASQLLGFIFVAVLNIVALIAFYFRAHNPCKAQTPLSTESGVVISVSVCQDHIFSKPQVDSITLLKGLGVEGDAHCGATVQHRSRLKIRPAPPNLRQVHLIQSELFDEFKSVTGCDESSYIVKPGDLGENVTTLGLDLLALGAGTRLHFFNPGEEDEGKEHPVITITGLRNPCPQISTFRKGLQERCLLRNANGDIVERKAGIMATVEIGGIVRKGARIMVKKSDTYVELPCV